MEWGLRLRARRLLGLDQSRAASAVVCVCVRACCADDMGFSLRSLLLAAIVISNCITWTASRHSYTHNVSGHRRRHRRQGGKQFLPESYVIPGGEGSEKGWGTWGPESPCSRTCGGGVSSQKRICLTLGSGANCTGGDTKYFSCNTDPCPDSSLDYRAEQCASFNGKPFNGKTYDWVPYTNGPRPCELNCMPKGERFYYRHAIKVVDGTLCNDESFDVCVNGECQPVGCDFMLGSKAREDKCRNCRGNGTKCHTNAGLIDDTDLPQGYNDILLIPEGATNIVIEEIDKSNNYLALRSKQDNKYYLNGNYQISFPHTMQIAGTLWHYIRDVQGFAAPDKLRCLGPIEEPLYLSLLLQETNVGVKYEYSIPEDKAPHPETQYTWAHDEFSPCSVSCGTGFKTRNVTCRDKDKLDIAEDRMCEAGLRPIANETCQLAECLPEWVPSPWGPCSKLCGTGGSQARQVQCQKTISNGYPSIVDENQCFRRLGDKPEEHQKCNVNATCPTWFTGPWKPCDKLCGDGKQTRQVVCHRKTNGRVEVLVDSSCEDEKPETEQPCNIHPCDGIDWVISNWTGCDSCVSKFYTREAKCVTKDRQVVEPELCSYHRKPELQKPCDEDSLPSCESQWYATQWSNCSVDCGKGEKTRKVFCGFFDGGAVQEVDESKCDADAKYNDTTPCEVSADECPAIWFAADWSECTKECDGGQQFRKVMCLSGGNSSTSCPEGEMPDVEQSCNVEPCNIDELISVSSTTVMDDDDLPDCEDEDEVGAELFTSTSLSDMMFSDASSTTLEGSGASETEFDFSSFSTVTGTDTTDTGSGDTDLTTDSSTTSSGETSESTVTGETTESSVADTGSTTTDSTGTGSTDSTVSSGTDSESTDSTVSGETTVTGPTDASSKDTSTGTGGSPGSTRTGGSTVAGETKAPGLAGTGPTTPSGTTVSGPTEESSAPGSSTSDGTSASGLSTTEGTSVSGSGTTVSGTTDKSSDESPTTSSEPTETTSDATTSSSDSTSDSSTTVSDGSTTGGAETTTASGGTTTDKDGTTTVAPPKGETTAVPSISATSAYPRSTTASGTTDSEDTTVSGGSTLSSSDGSGSTTESGTGSTETTVEGSTVSTETGPTSDSSSASIGSTVSGGSSLSTTESSGSTNSGSTTESGSSTTDVSGSSDESSGSTTEGGTESTVSGGTSDSEGTTGSGASETTTESGTGSTTGGSTSSYDETTGSDETTGWDLSTILSTAKRCRPRNKPAKCVKSKFGCCPDKKTPAGGPFDEGCPSPTTCKDTKYGCCPDGVSPAGGPHNRDCPVPDCKETLYGCCKSDRKTPAEGNDQEGCPPKCKLSKFGCCADNETQATGPHKAGCPETSTTELSTEATTESGATDSTEFSTTEATTEAVTEACEIINGTEKCHPCSITEFGCCDDGDTAAHGPNKLGCCLLSAHGCCPDNLQPASGPDGEGCDCKNSAFGCCPDGKSYATGADNSGCGCEHTPHGCCPDRHTEATGPNFEGCSCHTFQFGCCPDGTTTAEGPNQQGCRCERSTHGCCGDGVTAATGPNQEGCDCASSKYGCCLDGVTEAQSKNFSGCAEAPINKQAACGLAYEQGPCTNYSVQWFYDTDYGGCSRFHYGGCGGNGNRFADKAECEDVCVHPAGKDACRLPAVKASCTNNLSVRWYWDDSYQACLQFHYGGCLGNANNYLSREECEKKCSPRLNPEDTCTLALDKGPCAGNFSRWGHNEETGRCEEFLWGGCEGNNNRFPSEAACILKCDPPGKQQPACEQPQDAGNCTEMLPYWSFSQEEQRCVPFYYGGCGGNDNKFRDQKSCDDACPKAYEKDKCTLPADTGNCRSNFTLRWFFDTKHQQCRQFPYGGCGGNENNFLREEICNSECNRPVARPPAPQDICQLPQDMGPCRAFVTRWYFDRTYQQCRQFYYGGCKGNANNFQTQEECQSGCVRPIAPPTEPTPTDICTLPPAVGLCRAAHLRYYFDPRAGRCAPFTYGGCGGNQNNFANEQECQQRCSPVPVPPPVSAECRVASISQCVGVGRVWYLDPRSGRCTPYDPRPGASNCQLPGVFSSPEACERACGDFREIGDVCRMEKDPGPCSERQPKYYFDSTTRSCESFAYGGCFGSANRFSSPEECESVCLGESLDPCKLPPSAGNCTEKIESWYYDEERDDCGEFYYTGCSGNDNRFASRDECLGKCKTGAEPPSENEQCLTPTSLEACGDDVPGFYYDHIQGRCLSAPIGGCTENPNNYRTAEECERTCGSFKGQDVCRAPLDPGPCRADHPKFYWNLREGRCEAYTYGGCNGGPNRFSNQEECEEVCGHLTIDPACGQAPAPGVPCAGAGGGGGTARWHRSPLYGDCRLFIYYGCGGNGNNFGSKEACERHCSPPPAGYDPSENEVVECAAQAAACERLRCEFGTTRSKDAYGCDSCSCDPNPCADIVCPPGTRCDLVPDRDLATGEPKYTSQCRPADCSAEKARCASLDCELSMQTTRGPDGCERCECVRPEPNCQPFVDECNALKCNYGPITRTTDADGCERCTCIAHPCEGKRCPEGQRCVVSASRDAITGDTQYSGDCGTVDKPGTCPAEQGSAGSCHVECNDDADCRGVQKCCRSGCSQLCRAPAAPENNVQQPVAPQAPEPNPETEREVTSSVGGTATLRCLFHSNPPPQITWKKGEITIDGTQGRYRLTSDGALQIVSLYRDDSGVYICVGQNELGSSQQEIVLNVAGPVEAPAGIVGETESDVIGDVGHALRVRCLAYGYPEPSIAWYHRPTGTMVPYDSAKYELRGSDMLIKSLDIDTLGDYTCQVYNGLGKAVSWTVTVRAERPAGSRADSPYLLQRGAPAPPRTERPAPPRSGSASYVEIPPAPPQFTVPVRTTLRAQQTALATGGILELSCEVDGHPEPRVYWTKDNAQLAESDRIYITPARLSVSRLVEEDAGVYGCHADNGHSSHHSVVQISVQKLYIPDLCKDNQYFADCKLIVRSKLCRHEYYSKFCCKSCVEAGALDAQTLEFQGDDAFTYKKK